MKRILLLLTILTTSFAFSQENLFFYSYRHVPADEMELFKSNEADFWSKVHGKLVKEEKITGWAMLSRVGGLASDPNIYFFVGVGSFENLDNMGANYSKAIEEVMSSMDANAQNKMKERLKQEKFEVGTAMLNRGSTIMRENAEWNYLVHNYAHATNVGGFMDAQDKYFKPFFEEHINANNTKQVGWITARVMNPVGYAYKWNCYTADAFKNMSDIYNSWSSDDITWPEGGMEAVNKTTSQPGFYKRVIWRKDMWLDEEGNLQVFQN